MLLKYILFLSIIFNLSVYSQNDDTESENDRKALDFYKNLYKSGDSLKLNGKLGQIEAKTYKIADSLDNLYPSVYFEKSMEYMKKLKLNDAAFLYFIGISRFTYLNHTNPNYKPSGDGALKVALSYIIGEPIGMYLKTDIDNFTLILELSKKYYLENDFKYYSKTNNINNFDLQTESYSKQILDLKKNKKKYIKDWKKERKQIEKNLYSN